MQPPSFSSLRILVIDDDRDIADCLARLLRCYGHQACVAYSGLGALLAAGASPPDLLLVDVVMPGMDGYEVAREVKTNPMLRDVAVIMVSASSSETNRQKSLAAGCVDFLPKPVELPRLKGMLNEVARRRQEAGALT
jgi:CheY-like chemotaxis protein